ncbi:Hypothetical_protein [Hexamita inflata]|uniref:Hypothetical_protein n=1 Tax=Hexamita inflata TaxID=28002 RepID=A0AA86R1J2_9EUKA|nr:Hypothetical protein HINF_LOCUS51773 [Hexamita inflata]
MKAVQKTAFFIIFRKYLISYNYLSILKLLKLCIVPTQIIIVMHRIYIFISFEVKKRSQQNKKQQSHILIEYQQQSLKTIPQLTKHYYVSEQGQFFFILSQNLQKLGLNKKLTRNLQIQHICQVEIIDKITTSIINYHVSFAITTSNPASPFTLTPLNRWHLQYNFNTQQCDMATVIKSGV